jgi:predicted permease
MADAVLAVLPVFIVIALGWAARASGLLPREQWVGIDRLAYWAFFPALIFTNIARADFAGVAAGPFLAAVAGGFATLGALALLLRLALRRTPGPTFTSVVQGTIRWNGSVLIAAVGSAFGAEALGLAALVFAPAVVIANVVSVGALSVWGRDAKPSWREFSRRLGTNPLVLACILGALANASGLFGTGPAADALDLLADAAIAGGLMGVGAGLDLMALRGARAVLALAVTMKLAVMPMVLWAWALLLHLPPLATAVLVTAGATPGAAASYVLARAMGGDAELTAGHVTATVLLSVLTLPLWIAAVSMAT